MLNTMGALGPRQPASLTAAPIMSRGADPPYPSFRPQAAFTGPGTVSP